MSEDVPRGLYKPPKSPYWWVRMGANGKRIRCSTRCKDLPGAIAVQADLQAKLRTSLIEDGWRQEIQRQARDCDSWLRRTYSHMRRKTRLRGWGRCMTLAELTQLALKSQGICAVSGLPFARKPARPGDPFSVSIDRVDCSRGYVTENCRLVLLAVNIGMSHWGEDVLRRVARAVAGSELLSASSGNSIPEPQARPSDGSNVPCGT